MENNLLTSWEKLIEGSKRMNDRYRCELCLSVDTNGKNVTCSITGNVIADISKRNVECPIDKHHEGSKHVI